VEVVGFVVFLDGLLDGLEGVGEIFLLLNAEYECLEALAEPKLS
jgi:hypothetical protein